MIYNRQPNYNNLMGKQGQEPEQNGKTDKKQNLNSRVDQKQQTDNIPNEPKRKIIKKFPFKGALNNKQDDLKDWKPTKIQKRADNKTNNSQIKSLDLGQKFLSSLSKPVNKVQNQKRPIFFDDDEPLKILSKPTVNIAKLTPEQIKWDIQDQTFIKRNLVPNLNVERQLQENQAEQQEPVEKIIIKGKEKQYFENQTPKMKHIDLSKIINKNWQQTAKSNSTTNQLWEGSQGLLDGHGGLSKLAKQAQSRAHQIEQQMNKRSYEKKQMKSRYGW